MNIQGDRTEQKQGSYSATIDDLANGGRRKAAIYAQWG